MKLSLHAFVVFLLHLHALFDPPLRFAKCPVLQFADQLGIETCLLCSNGIQVADTIHVILCGSHVQRRVVVVVQAPYVGTKRHKKEKAVEVTIGSCQVEWCVSPYVTLVRVSSVDIRHTLDKTIRLKESVLDSLNK